MNKILVITTAIALCAQAMAGQSLDGENNSAPIEVFDAASYGATPDADTIYLRSTKNKHAELRTDLSQDTPSISADPTITDELSKAREILASAQKELDRIKSMERQQKAKYEAAFKELHQRETQVMALADAQTRNATDQLTANIVQRTIDPVTVMNERVSVGFSQSVTLQEIIEALMPAGWKVVIDLRDNPAATKETHAFRTTSKRHEALAALQAGLPELNIHYYYFFDLVDKDGNPAPELIVSDKKSLR